MSFKDSILKARKAGASDLHLEAGTAMVARVRGELTPVGEPLTGAQLMGIAQELLTQEDWADFNTRGSVDLSLVAAGARCRINLFRTIRGLALAVRLLPQSVGDLRACNLHPDLRRLVTASAGLVLVSGPTGSGKTTWTKALIREIPADERLITIEDAQELILDRHANHVRLYYSKDDQGQARVTPKQLLESCLRMRPDRILLAELRAEEAFDYLRSVNSGHPGSITSVHATSAELAFEQLVLLIKQSPGGRDLARADIKGLLYLLIDVVIQCGVERHERFIKEIWFHPECKRRDRALS